MRENIGLVIWLCFSVVWIVGLVVIFAVSILQTVILINLADFFSKFSYLKLSIFGLGCLSSNFTQLRSRITLSS